MANFCNPTIAAQGPLSGTPASVATPVTLNPALPAGLVAGNFLLCVTVTVGSATPTVATPSGYTSLLNVTGTSARIACFGKIATGSESVPGVTWSSLTTGTSGTPALAKLYTLTDVDVSGTAANAVDVAGTVSNQVASTTVAAGGSAITTLQTNSLVIVISARLDDAGSWTTLGASDGVTWSQTNAGSNTSTSGADGALDVQYGLKAAAGSVAAKSLTLTGASSFASSGVMLALKANTAVISSMM